MTPKELDALCVEMKLWFAEEMANKLHRLRSDNGNDDFAKCTEDVREYYGLIMKEALR